MDGLKKRLNASIQLKLSVALSLAIVLIALVAGVFSFVSAFSEAHELQDDMLRQVAALSVRPPVSTADPGGGGSNDDVDAQARVIVEALPSASAPAGQPACAGALPLPAALPDGLQTVDVGGQPYRVLVKTGPYGQRVAVAQNTGVRDEAARDSAVRTLMPFLLLLPVLLLIVADLVRKMFRPISALSAEIDARAEADLYRVDERHLPAEVRGFVVAINRLLARVEQSMATQRRFVADAAHELRSPLTALSLQAERLAQVDLPDLAHARLVALRRGIERGRKLLDQLLALARAQASPGQPVAPVSVLRVYRQVLEDLMPLAQAKHIDIGVEEAQDVQLCVDELDLRAVVKNLADNAIRYTPEGGRVDLSVRAYKDLAVLNVRDSGPGIELNERMRVFDPFYRIVGSGEGGSGLGLSIVKAVTDRIGAEIRLGFTDESHCRGLSVCVIVRTCGSSQK